RAEVGDRVPERAQLPVEDRAHLAVGTDDQVGEAVVAVDQRNLALRWYRGMERPRDPLNRVEFAGLGRIPLPGPTAKLALGVAFPTPQVPETDPVDVHLVEGGQRLDRRDPDSPARARLQVAS